MHGRPVAFRALVETFTLRPARLLLGPLPLPARIVLSVKQSRRKGENARCRNCEFGAASFRSNGTKCRLMIAIVGRKRAAVKPEPIFGHENANLDYSVRKYTLRLEGFSPTRIPVMAGLRELWPAATVVCESRTATPQATLPKSTAAYGWHPAADSFCKGSENGTQRAVACSQ